MHYESERYRDAANGLLEINEMSTSLLHSWFQASCSKPYNMKSLYPWFAQVQNPSSFLKVNRLS
jgi:hypothetical protein